MDTCYLCDKARRPEDPTNVLTEPFVCLRCDELLLESVAELDRKGPPAFWPKI